MISTRDPVGDLWAHPSTPPPWWAVGSHLDSVRGGGRFDGPVGVASRSPSRALSRTVRGELQRAAGELLGAPASEAVCFAGHDAGVLAARVPAAMVLVRNRTGISHSPREAIDLEDGEVGVRVIKRTLSALIGAA